MAGAHRTLTDLQNNRRKGFIPDISFDLDGDGIVGNRDLVISKLFDKDGDGKLNKEERKNAEDAIKNVSRSKLQGYSILAEPLQKLNNSSLLISDRALTIKWFGMWSNPVRSARSASCRSVASS